MSSSNVYSSLPGIHPLCGCLLAISLAPTTMVGPPVALAVSEGLVTPRREGVAQAVGLPSVSSSHQSGPPGAQNAPPTGAQPQPITSHPTQAPVGHSREPPPRGALRSPSLPKRGPAPPGSAMLPKSLPGLQPLTCKVGRFVVSPLRDTSRSPLTVRWTCHVTLQLLHSQTFNYVAHVDILLWAWFAAASLSP